MKQAAPDLSSLFFLCLPGFFLQKNIYDQEIINVNFWKVIWL